jgi:hypothetical protein
LNSEEEGWQQFNLGRREKGIFFAAILLSSIAVTYQI